MKVRRMMVLMRGVDVNVDAVLRRRWGWKVLPLAVGLGEVEVLSCAGAGPSCCHVRKTWPPHCSKSSVSCPEVRSACSPPWSYTWNCAAHRPCGVCASCAAPCGPKSPTLSGSSRTSRQPPHRLKNETWNRTSKSWTTSSTSSSSRRLSLP